MRRKRRARRRGRRRRRRGRGRRTDTVVDPMAVMIEFGATSTADSAVL